MTTLVILFLGGGAVLVLSAFESNPDGSDVSIIQTVKDIWDDKLDFKQGNTPSSSSTASTTPSSSVTPASAAAGQVQQSAL